MNSSHIDDGMLPGYLDGELEAPQARYVREHLDECEECRVRVGITEAALRKYRFGYQDARPTPPRPWEDLRPRLRELRLHTVELPAMPISAPRRTSRAWWAAAAAGIAVAFVTVRLSTEQTVNAAELLEQASVRDVPVTRLHVKTRKGSFVRANRSAADAELETMFREANFDWQDPLRARAFADWRDSLGEKTDEVRVLQNPDRWSGRYFRIRTSTPAGALSEVSIMIRAVDLRAVEERFEFRNQEWVEIREAPPEPREAPLSIAQSPAGDATGKAPAPVSVSDEIRALSALHKIGADLGEPIEVHRNGTGVEVVVLGASERREKEIREALRGLSNVTPRFDRPQAVRQAGEGATPPETAEETPSSAMQSRLLMLMGSAANVEAFTNRVLEESEAAMARAHALRQSSDRFPSRESLPSEDRATLRAIESDHLRAFRSHVQKLGEVLQPLTGPIEGRAAASSSREPLLSATQRLDTLLSLALASGEPQDDPDKTVEQIRQALVALEQTSREYKL